MTWIDPRPDAFPAYVPGNVVTVQADDPAAVLANAPDGAFILAMTHSHPLDLAVAAAGLGDPRFPYVGVIGSKTKRARFTRQLAEGGIPRARVAELVCPIGVLGDSLQAAGGDRGNNRGRAARTRRVTKGGGRHRVGGTGVDGGSGGSDTDVHAAPRRVDAGSDRHHQGFRDAPRQRQHQPLDQAGEIHALLGENGAGKSTLVKILYGSLQPTAGEIKWKGKAVTIANPAAARKLGIGMVFQHFSLFDALTVAENIALALSGDTSLADLKKKIGAVSADYGLPLNPDSVVADLSVGERQRVEIVRCLLQEPELIIMDEPTSVLTPQEADDLFVTLKRLSSEGVSILYISHRLEEVRAICHPRRSSPSATRRRRRRRGSPR